MSATDVRLLLDPNGDPIPQYYDTATNSFKPIVNSSYTLTSTPVTVTTSGIVLIAANANRKFLAWQNTGANDVAIAPGSSPVAFGVATFIYASGGGTNMQGAGEVLPGKCGDAFYAITKTGTSTVTVWEGN